MNIATTEPALKRSLSLGLITMYGLGNIIGAGIYVLIGKVAASAGIYTPISFLLASLQDFIYQQASGRTPASIVTIALFVVVNGALIQILMALWLPVEKLAHIASLLLLVVFMLVNLALLRIKQKGMENGNIFVVPVWVPLGGFVSSSAFLLYQLIAGIAG